MKLLNYFALFCIVLTATSCTNQDDGEYIPGLNGPEVNIQDGKILIQAELVNINLGTSLSVGIPKMPNSYISLSDAVYEDGSLGGTQIDVSFDLKDVESDDFQSVPPQVLPDGRPFPFMVDGTLPGLAFYVPKAKEMTFYASTKLFGFFLPLKIPSDFVDEVSYRIRINGKNYGVVALVHPDERGEGSGVVVLLTLDDVRNNPELKKLLNYSKKHKNIIF